MCSRTRVLQRRWKGIASTRLSFKANEPRALPATSIPNGHKFCPDCCGRTTTADPWSVSGGCYVGVRWMEKNRMGRPDFTMIFRNNKDISFSQISGNYQRRNNRQAEPLAPTRQEKCDLPSGFDFSKGVASEVIGVWHHAFALLRPERAFAKWISKENLMLFGQKVTGVKRNSAPS